MSKLRVGAPLAVEGTVLIPVEHVAVEGQRHRHGLWFDATKEVIAMVVCEPDRLRAIDVRARELPVEELVREIPGLAALIASQVEAAAHDRNDPPGDAD